MSTCLVSAKDYAEHFADEPGRTLICFLCRKPVTRAHPTVAGYVCPHCKSTPAGRDATETPDERDTRLFGSCRPDGAA
jgi:hypothetical protein